jgi:pantetheine-phosphate adenylyltransferase
MIHVLHSLPFYVVSHGTFQPSRRLCLGHEDIIRRGASLFDKLTVGIGINPDKKPLFSPEERLSLCREVLAPLENVEVNCFEGLAVDYVKSCKAQVMLRGVRTLTDIESEFTMSLANRMLAPDVETVFLMSSDQFTHISSSLIKQIAQMAKENSAVKLKEFVPAPVIPQLIEKFPR